MANSSELFTDDKFLGGRLILRQPRKGHRAGHDAMLLAASTTAQSGDRVVEFGAGVGAAGLALATRVSGLHLVLVEIDPDLVMLAQCNAITNGIAARVLELDVAASANVFALAELGPDTADVVLMNPPFNNPAQHRVSPEKNRARAHVSTNTTLVGWVHAARRTLKPGGTLTMIWRADAVGDVLNSFDRGFGTLIVQPVHSAPDAAAIRILVRAIKGGRAPLRILPALVIGSDIVRSSLSAATELPLAKF